MPTVLIILVVLGLLALWLMVSYNNLVKSRMHTKEAWSQIDVQLKRRNDLIPNLIETVKGYANYEQKHLKKSLICVRVLLMPQPLKKPWQLLMN